MYLGYSVFLSFFAYCKNYPLQKIPWARSTQVKNICKIKECFCCRGTLLSVVLLKLSLQIHLHRTEQSVLYIEIKLTQICSMISLLLHNFLSRQSLFPQMLPIYMRFSISYQHSDTAYQIQFTLQCFSDLCSS